MNILRKSLLTAISSIALAASVGTAAQAETIRVALGDVASVEQLALLVAFERAREKGLDYEMTVFAKEELAIQALVSGQMDIGIGSPYSVIQQSKAPLRLFFQVSKLVFFPVVEKSVTTWADMNGKPITLHSRGGGTDAIANIIEDREGITFGERSYVPGSENRVIAMIQGQVNASIVDLSNKNKLLAEAGDRFAVLPMFEVLASDEVLFANQDWITGNPEDVAILVEALAQTWKDMTTDPTIIEKERVKYNLLADLPPELLTEVDAYYAEAVAGGLYSPTGGGMEAVLADFEFYSESGQLEGDKATFKVEDFWDLGPLNAALAKIGG